MVLDGEISESSQQDLLVHLNGIWQWSCPTKSAMVNQSVSSAVMYQVINGNVFGMV